MTNRPWRHTVSNIGYLRLLLLIVAVNAAVLLLHYILASGNCRSARNRRNHLGEDDVKYPSLAKLASPTEYFNWEEEAKELSKIVPVMESYKSNSDGPKAQGDIPTSPIINDNSLLKNLVQLLKSNRPVTTTDNRILMQAIENDKILGCKALKSLDDTMSFPRLKPTFSGRFNQTAGLDLDAKRSYDVTSFTYRRTSDVKVPADSMKAVMGTEAPPNDEDARFMHALDELNKLIRTQGWPGIPRLYAACLTTRDGIDLIEEGGENAHFSLQSLRFVVHRYEKNMGLCKSEVYDEECDNLRDVYRTVLNDKSPPLAAIKLMMGFTKVFGHFWRNGLFPYKLRPNDVIITKDFDVIMRSMKSIKVFPQSLGGRGQFVRPLSDMSCRNFLDCPTPNWEGQQLLFRFGQHCKEVRGHCDDKNRCWGMDSSVYLCLFAKWLFTRLHNLVPPSWEDASTLDKALKCAARASPEYRCSWTSFERTLQNILEHAIEKWG